MAKWNRMVVGSVYKSKPGKDGSTPPDYVKLRGDAKVRDALAKALLSADPEKGLNLKLESKKFQLDSLDQAEADGKLSADIAGKVRERLNKIPDYVRFEMVLLTKED